MFVCVRARPYVYDFNKYEASLCTLKLIRKQEPGGFKPQNKIKNVNTNKTAQNNWMEWVKKTKDLHIINCKEAETENDVGKYTMGTGGGTASTAYLY